MTLDGRVVTATQSGYVYLLLHKPVGLLTTTRDDFGRSTVMDLLPVKYRGKRLFPVGRLDKDSSGLLLLTNDGRLAYRLTHPRFEHEKEYVVQLDAKLSAADLGHLRNGLDLGDGVRHRARCRRLRGESETRYVVVIHEGRKRQIRRMFASLGRRVLRLHRVRFGPLRLQNLGSGQCRELTSGEIRRLGTL